MGNIELLWLAHNPLRYAQSPRCKMRATTVNVINSFSTIFPSYLLFLKKDCIENSLHNNLPKNKATALQAIMYTS